MSPSSDVGEAARCLLPLPCLMLVTEPSERLPGIVAQAVAGGVNLVQWRDKRLGGFMPSRAEKLAMLTAARPALLLANTGAVFPGINGFHAPERAVNAGGVRRNVSGRLVGCSVHSVDTARQAADEGADYVVAGTIFASQSHPDIAPAGLDFLRAICAAVPVPVLAIGGVTPDRVRECITAGAAGVAVLSPIMRAADPRAVAQEYRAALDAAWEERTCR